MTYLTLRLPRHRRQDSTTSQLYFDASGELDGQRRPISSRWCGPRRPIGDLVAAKIGSKDQPVLAKRATTSASTGATCTWPPRSDEGSVLDRRSRGSARTDFVKDGLTTKISGGPEQPVAADAVAAAVVLQVGNVSSKPVSRWLMLAYDDLYSIQYMQKNLRPYWRRNGWEAADLLKAAAKDYASLQEALRRVRRGADGRPDQGRRREVRQAVRAGLSPVLRGGQVRRRRQRPAAAVLQGEPLQRLHRHVGRVLPDGPAVPAVRPVAGQVVPGAVHELRGQRALEVPLRPARPGHVPARQRPGLRRRRADRGEPDARRGERQPAAPHGRPRPDGRQRRLRRPLLAAAGAMGRVPQGQGLRPGEPALHRRLRRPPRPQREPQRQGDLRPGRVRQALRPARRQGQGRRSTPSSRRSSPPAG